MVGTCYNCGCMISECECFNDEAQPVTDNKEQNSTSLVKNPASTHYELWDGFESIDVIKEILTPEEYRGFLKGNILKYQLRLGKKDAVEKEMIKIKDYQRELGELLNADN